MNEKKQRLLAESALVFTTLVWGCGFAIVKNTLNELSPMWFATLRFSVAAILMAPIFLKRMKKYTKNDFKMGLLAGILLFLANSAQIIGAQWTTAGKSAFLTSVYIVMVPFLSIIFFKNKVNIYNFFAAAMCMFGVGLLTLERGFSINAGDIFTLACAFLFALHIMILSHAKDADAICVTYLQMLVTAVLSLMCAVTFEGNFPSMNMDIVLAVSYLGIFGNMLAFTLQTFAQKHLSASHASLFLSLEAVFGALISAVALKEQIDLKMLIGCALILLAVVSSETKFNFLKAKSK